MADVQAIKAALFDELVRQASEDKPDAPYFERETILGTNTIDGHIDLDALARAVAVAVDRVQADKQAGSDLRPHQLLGFDTADLDGQ